MELENYVGKRGVFTSYEDKTWTKYAGKEAIIRTFDQVDNDYAELLVEFEDGKCLTIGSDEFELI